MRRARTNLPLLLGATAGIALAGWLQPPLPSLWLLALPAVAALLMVNLAFGVITRAAPQMNIFAVGFPVTMLLGFAIMFATSPALVPQMQNLMVDAFGLVTGMIGGAG